MNSKDFIQTLRKVIREEVQLAVRTELNKITPVINENKSVSKYTDSIRSTVKPKVYSSNTTKKQFASNTMLNDILNDTAGFRNENAGAYLEESIDYNDMTEWPTMNRATAMSPKSIIPSVDTEGRKIDVTKLASTEAGAAVVNAITKDYSALMKAIDKKKGK